MHININCAKKNKILTIKNCSLPTLSHNNEISQKYTMQLNKIY